MKIFVIGSGGREHAIIWKLAQSKKVEKIICANGNAGIAHLAECVDISPEDIPALINFAKKEKPDLTVVGPEVPLVNGIVDELNALGLKVFGPVKKGAILEGSKAYSKDFMQKYNIPTAAYKNYSTSQDALQELDQYQYPLVVKADGLAAGKGVLICEDKAAAVKAIKEIMDDKAFGSAGEEIVIEEFLTGIEASLLCFVAGDKIIPMESARDYKRALDNDEGLNTGGMGCFSPNTIFNDELQSKIREQVLDRTLAGFQAEGIDFHGVLFIGFMVKDNLPKVLEYNVRFGDPEAEVVLPRLDSDLVDIMEKTIDGTLEQSDLVWSEKKCVTVFLASGGYPGSYAKGKEMVGFETVDEGIILFHAGTKLSEEKTVTNGGRVIAITALGETIEQARNKVYKNVSKIKFEGAFNRTDIAKL